MFHLLTHILLDTGATVLATGGVGDTAADTTAATGGSSITSILSIAVPIALFALLFYFMLYRPQKKQERETKDMRNSLQVGDEISTTGGILGRVLQIRDDVIVIESGNTKMKLAKWAIRQIERGEDDNAAADDKDKGK